MANDTQITIVGNLTADPELRFTPSGSAVANFTIASTPRTFNRDSNEFVDGETLFLRASIWRDAAENVAESFTKGMQVIALGRLKARTYDTKEGEKRTVMELEVDEIGPSLRWARARVERVQRNGGGQGGQHGGGQGGQHGGGQGAYQNGGQGNQQQQSGQAYANAAATGAPQGAYQGGGQPGGPGQAPNAGGGYGAPGTNTPAGPAGQPDPWAAPSPGSGGWGAPAGQASEPPF